MAINPPPVTTKLQPLVMGTHDFAEILFNQTLFVRRSIGYFDVRRLDGTRIDASANYKKLRLLQKRKSFLTELRI